MGNYILKLSSRSDQPFLILKHRSIRSKEYFGVPSTIEPSVIRSGALSYLSLDTISDPLCFGQSGADLVRVDVNRAPANISEGPVVEE